MSEVWKLEDAKARFSEVVRRARAEGPQHVSVRGKPAVVVISADDHRRRDIAKPELSFVEFMQSLHPLGEIIPEREPDYGRDLSELFPEDWPASPDDQKAGEAGCSTPMSSPR